MDTAPAPRSVHVVGTRQLLGAWVVTPRVQFRTLPSSPCYPTQNSRWKTGGRSPTWRTAVAHFHERGWLHGHTTLCRCCSPKNTRTSPWPGGRCSPFQAAV